MTREAGSCSKTINKRTHYLEDQVFDDPLNGEEDNSCPRAGNTSRKSLSNESDSLIDISVYTNYLPHSYSVNVNRTEESDDEDEVSQEITVLAGNRSNEGWPANMNIPSSWRDKINNINEDDDEVSQEIPVFVGNRSNEGWPANMNIPSSWRDKSNNITVRKDNRCILASKLPTIFVTNHRSFFPKFNNFLELVKTLDLTLGLHSEVWEDKEKKDHQNKIEEAMELEGVHYISNPRPKRRGGGAAITLVGGDFTLTRLDVVTPRNLEVVWGLVRPNQPTKDFKGIIVCSFYSVPRSKRKTQLIEHIAINYGELRTRYKDCFFLTGGDKNDLDLKLILDISPTFHTHNTKPTYGQKNIDVLVSDMVHLFNEPIIIPNVPTDIPDGQPGGGKISDHPVVYTMPRLNRTQKPARELVVKKTRRIKDEDILKIGQWIQQESWVEMLDCGESMATKYSEIVFAKLDEICPEVEVKITKMDGKVTSLALQKLARQRLREYTLNGNSKKFKEIKKKQKQRISYENKKEIEKKIENSTGKGMKWVKDASRMSARPGDDTSSTFSLPAHVDANFTPLQSAEAIASYFAKISQEYTPIESDISASWLEAKKKLDEAECCHPVIMEHQVFQTMKAAKKTDSVPGDIPAAILKEFLPELAFPVTEILKQAVTTHTWPASFKKEYHLPLKKIPAPASEDDLRGIGLSSFVSKQLERLVLNWIWPYIRNHVDPDQMGGMPGCSIEHYITKMTDFILRSMDGNPDAAVIAVPVDYSKAFNRMLHSDILSNLVALNVPTCSVKLITSYLTQRTMCVRYKGAVSSFYSMPGGGPQGGLLTSVFFIL